MIYLLKYLSGFGLLTKISTDCINDAINKGVFPDSLKIANITPAHEKNKPADKENYRPVSLLSLLSKVLST